jgi:hypothetical protein
MSYQIKVRVIAARDLPAADFNGLCLIFFVSLATNFFHFKRICENPSAQANCEILTDAFLIYTNECFPSIVFH